MTGLVGLPYEDDEGTGEELSYLILTIKTKPNGRASGEFVSVTIREGLDFLDEDIQEHFGDFTIMATA